MIFLGVLGTKGLNLLLECLAALGKCLWPSADNVFANNCLKTLNEGHCNNFIQNLVMRLLVKYTCVCS